jgi:ABC-type transport system involved in cytochrome bd biosynthesis fused ATPase/permease subunit
MGFLFLFSLAFAMFLILFLLLLLFAISSYFYSKKKNKNKSKGKIRIKTKQEQKIRIKIRRAWPNFFLIQKKIRPCARGKKKLGRKSKEKKNKACPSYFYFYKIRIVQKKWALRYKKGRAVYKKIRRAE